MARDSSAPDRLQLCGATVFQASLRPLDLRLAAGDHLVVSGPRGSGKTLLAEALTGRRRLTAGSLTYPFLGSEVAYAARREAIRLVSFHDHSRLSRGPNHEHYYQQRFNAFDAGGHPTVADYLRDSGYAPGLQAAAVETFGLAGILDRERIKLSSGQTRKLLLARELLGHPRLVVIDNPYAGLDPASRAMLNELLDRLVKDLGITLVLHTNAADLPGCISGRLHLGTDGHWSVSGRDTYERPSPVINAASLNRLAAQWQASLGEVTREIVHCENVRVGYDGHAVIDGLDWRVTAGDRWVVHGPNGSGKSTLLSLIYADHPQAYANKVFLFGQRRGKGDSIWDIKRRIGFASPELAAHFRERLTAREVVLTGLTDTFLRPRRVSEAAAITTDTLLDYFGLKHLAGQPFPTLSSGTQRLLLLCRALVKLPPLLLLDEPFQGLDAVDVGRARALLSGAVPARATVIFISHFREEVPAGSDWQVLDLGAV